MGMAAEKRIQNTADKVKKTALLYKGTAIILVSLILLTSVTYIISYFYNRFSSFTVSVEDYDMIKQGLTLSETPEFVKPTARINSSALKNCTNISGDTIPDDVTMINGEHNGTDYLAYTFYVKNSGKDTVTYRYGTYLSNVTKNVDAAIRVRLYVNDNAEIFAKTKNDGTGPEDGTTQFMTQSVVEEKLISDFRPGDVTKFTIVIWLEGNDPECIDDIVGGRFKVEMAMSIVENS